MQQVDLLFSLVHTRQLENSMSIVGCFNFNYGVLGWFQDRKLAQEGLWAHATQFPEEGGLLLAAPTVDKNQLEWQLVIVLLQHSVQGSRGLIINRPCSAYVGDLAASPQLDDQVFSQASFFLSFGVPPSRLKWPPLFAGMVAEVTNPKP